MDPMNNNYVTLFVGELVQDTFLSMGGISDPDSIDQHTFCRDGLGRPSLRGESLAGSLVALLKRILIGQGKSLPTYISGSHQGEEASVWRCFNSHPSGDTAFYGRPHNAHTPETAAARPTAYYDVETLPPGTRWPFVLEVDTRDHPEVLELTRQTLSHWSAGRCLLGREVSRGMGWLNLVDLKEYTVTIDDVYDWPCSEQTHRYPDYIKETFKQEAEFLAQPDALPGWIEIDIKINVGLRDDEYGLDSLSVGGGIAEQMDSAWDSEIFLGPQGMTRKAQAEAFDPDVMVLAYRHELQDADGSIKIKKLPFIPGSTIKGNLRHELARLCKVRGMGSAPVKRLFGSEVNDDPQSYDSSHILVSDALADPENPVQLAWMQHHAKDEFTGGVYASAKFDRVAVLQGTFNFKMVLEDVLPEDKVLIAELLTLAKNGQLAIGGGQWRGHGWMSWDCNTDQLRDGIC